MHAYACLQAKTKKGRRTMPLPIGEYIRQLRRQRSLTQTELGGDHFSKSYVSAVERDKIVPSHDALRFFAEQLDQSVETFEQLLQQSEQIKQMSPAVGLYATPANDENEQEIVALLDLVLKGKEYYSIPLPQIITDFSLEMNVLPSQQKQARYAFLKGLQAQENNELPAAQSYLEYALALAPVEYRSAILDALGTNFYLSRAYESALGYHSQALKILKENSVRDTDFLLYVELHCANDYRTLRAHDKASFHYEQARHYLRATHNLQIAGELYLGLGYCMYASLFQSKTIPHSLAKSRLSVEEVDRSYQLALNFLLQSRTLYQVSSDQKGEFTARLTQAMVLLDFSTWRLQVAREKVKTNGHRVPPINCTSLLDDAEEQCNQVLLGWQETFTKFTTPPMDQQLTLYTALAYLARVFTRRAALARVGGYYDTAIKDLSHAIYVCQQTLDLLQNQALSWKLVRDAINLSGSSLSYHSPSLPRLPDPSISLSYNPTISAEVYFAAGEISAELGAVSASLDYTQECYDHSDQFFQLTLDSAHLDIPDEKRDFSYLIRFYQRYTNILEQRSVLNLTQDNTSEKLLHLLKKALAVLQQPVYESSIFNL